MDEVNEGVTNIALGFQIHGQVKIIVVAFVILVDHVQELHLFELIRDVPNHDSSSIFYFVHYPIEINVVSLSITHLFFFFRCLSHELRFF